MSFESGFNQGLNLTASLRANAARAADREQQAQQFDQAQEFREESFEYSKERDAVRDEMAQKEFDLNQRLTDLKATQIRRDMEAEQQLRNRLTQERAKSQVEFQAFTEKVNGLDMTSEEGRKSYNDALATHLPGITDPDTMRRFSTFNDLRMQGAASHLGTIFQAQKAAQVADLAQAAMDFETDVKRAPESPEELAQWRSYQEVAGRIDDQDISWGQLEVEGLTRGDWTSMTPEIAAQAKAKIEDIEAERAKDDLTVSQFETIQGLERSASMMVNLERAAEQLDIPTGAAFGPLLAKLKRALGDDVSVSNFESTLQGVIPGLARGFFGEVGVLTDTDIENYKKVVASLGQTKEANRVVLAATQALVNAATIRTLDLYDKMGKKVAGFENLKRTAEASPIGFYADPAAAGDQIVADFKAGRLKQDSKVSVYDPETKQVRTMNVGPMLRSVGL